MVEKILEWWVLWACGILGTALAALWRWAYKKFKQQREREREIEERQRERLENMEEGIRAILHDRIFQAGRFHAEQGYCTLEEKRNIEYLYRPYAALGGNGTGESIYEDIMGLPTVEHT